MKKLLSPIRILVSLLLIAVLVMPTASFANTNPTDPVIEWNTILLNLIREEKTTPPKAAREMAVVHVAIYEAVNSIHKTHEPYDVYIESTPNASDEAAAITAAYYTLVNLYPTHAQTLTNLKNESLSRLSANKDIAEGIKIGEKSAKHILELRSTDNHDGTSDYTPKNQAGKWEPTLPGYGGPLYPHWGTVTPFSGINLKQFFPQGPPALDTQEYANEVLEVQALGAKNSSVRTADQTEIAHFWVDGPGTFTPPGHWNALAQQVSVKNNYSLTDNARLFALLNIGLSDAAVLCWDVKYHFDLWRPITAIRNANQDGNPLTVEDPNWEPLIVTPPFPEYTSGHSTFSGAASVILALEFGDNTSFTAVSVSNPSIQRSFTSFSQAANEAMNSRLYGGIHFRSGNEHGLSSGEELGKYIAQNMLKPKATPTATPTPTTTPIVLATQDEAKPVPVTAQTGFNLLTLALVLIGLGSTMAHRIQTVRSNG